MNDDNYIDLKQVKSELEERRIRAQHNVDRLASVANLYTLEFLEMQWYRIAHDEYYLLDKAAFMEECKRVKAAAK